MTLVNKEKKHKLIVHTEDATLLNHLSLRNGEINQLLSVKNRAQMCALLKKSVGATFLLDLSSYGDDVEHPTVTDFFKRGGGQKIIVLTGQSDKASLYSLFEKGARGVCSPQLSPDLLLKAVRVVDDGELWISRKLISYFMGRLHLDSVTRKAVQRPGDESVPANHELTRREVQIANCIGRGLSDKLVASELTISPNTVKNHLRNIYNKLKISDRFQLALICHGIDFSVEHGRDQHGKTDHARLS